jgi:PBSX family phage terminase large subunit
MQNPLSPKQISSYCSSNSRLNIWEGAVRSGKSFISLLRFIKAIKEGPPGAAMIVGVSRDALQRNVIIELCALIGIPPPTPKSSQMNILNRIIHLVGANDERAQRRIQGSTLAIAYVDELTLIPQGFFKMLLSRLSVPGAQLFGTTNPDSPFHWLKTDFLDNPDLEINRFHFKITDNPSLTQDYIRNISKEYSGLWYKRYIEGEWVLAEGTVYDFFSDDDHVIATPPGPADYYVLGIDYGTTNPTAFSLVGYNRKYWPNIWVEDEYYYDSRARGRQKTDTEYVEDLKRFIQGKNVRCIYVDPSAASFKLEMMRQGLTGIIDADNDVLNGIRTVSKFMVNGTLKVCACCKNHIREFQCYRWDEKVSLRGEDKPIKDNDHSLDALRYPIFSHFRSILTDDFAEADIEKIYAQACGVKLDLPSFFQDQYGSNPGNPSMPNVSSFY